MAEERDPQISQRYRELGAEAPPPELDRAILAAARRATTRRNRWYPSLAAAAVLIFAVAIVVQIERQPPDQAPLSAPPTPEAAPPTRDQVAPQVREAPAAKPAPRRPAPQFAPEPPPRAESAPAAPAPAPAPESNANIAAPAAGVAADAQRKRADEMRAAPQLQRSMAAPRSAASTAARDEEPPERWLERIIELRREGKQEEADKQLAAFRARYPDYKLPAAALKP